MKNIFIHIPLSYYAFTGLVNFITALILFILVITKNVKAKANRFFSFFALSVAAWSLFYFLWLVTVKHRELSEFYLRTCMIFVFFMPALFLHFVVYFLRIKLRKLYIVSNYILAVLFSLMVYSRFYAYDAEPFFTIPYWLHPGPVFHLAIIQFGVVIMFASYLIYKNLIKSNGIFKFQIFYLFVGTLIGFISGATNYFAWYRLPMPPVLNIFVSVYMGLIAYAILKYHLMDIRVAVTRTAIFVVVYTLVLAVPFLCGERWLKPLAYLFLGDSWWFVPLGVMAFLATIGPFTYIYLSRKAEDILLKEQRKYQNTLKRASLGMTRVRNLEKLLKLIVYTLTKAVRIEYASIYIQDKDNNGFDLKAIRGDCRVRLMRTRNDEEEEIASSLHRNDAHIPMETPLVKWLVKHQEPLVFEEIKNRLQDSYDLNLEELKNQLDFLGASIVVPSLIEDNLLGWTCLGDKRSGKIYTEDDLRVFTVLANQAALAIENARFFENSKEMQEQISQAEKMATIGTMADGLSHQINNRFHALSLIAGDTLDTLKIADTSTYNREQKELVAQVKYGLERICVNVSQGGEVVRGMLKYTRKGEEGFTPVTLESIVDSTLEMVQYKVKISEIDLIKDYPQELPPIHANLTQMQEVFFNLIDNAYESMQERKDILKEENYKPKIIISSRLSIHSNGFLAINIEDNGIGAKPEDLKKMFTPFFTTKVSSRQRKGTGLGLYVIKKIIIENHRGRIYTDSVYKQGMKFTIELPIAR